MIPAALPGHGEGIAVGYLQATLQQDGSVAELAWVVGSRWQGRGIAVAAAGLIAAHLRSRFPGVLLTAHIHPEHQASAAVARRIALRPTKIIDDGEQLWSSGRDDRATPGLLATDPRISVLQSILDATYGVVAGLRPEQHAAPTPCEEYDVRRLLEHLIGWQQVAGACLTGDELPFEDSSPTYSLPTDRAVEATERAVADLRHAADRLVAGVRDHPFSTVDYPYRGRTPVTVLLDEFVAETLLHTWDLAVAVGSPVGFRPAEIVAADRGLAAMLQESFAPIGFAPARPSAGSDLDALLARSGRDPGWQRG